MGIWSWSKDGKFIPSGLISTDNLSSNFFFFTLLAFFRQLQVECLKKTNCKESHPACSHFLTSTGACLEVMQKSLQRASVLPVGMLLPMGNLLYWSAPSHRGSYPTQIRQTGRANTGDSTTNPSSHEWQHWPISFSYSVPFLTPSNPWNALERLSCAPNPQPGAEGPRGKLRLKGEELMLGESTRRTWAMERLDSIILQAALEQICQ